MRAAYGRLFHCEEGAIMSKPKQCTGGVYVPWVCRTCGRKNGVLVDGGYYRKRAMSLWGEKSPEARAEELARYVFRHIDKRDGKSPRELYRVFYYDCPPVSKKVFHPMLGKTVDFSKEPMYGWANSFHDALRAKRKFALRMGRIATSDAHFQLDHGKVKKLMSGSISVEDLAESDFAISFRQKEVDMKIGVDVTSLAYEGIVSQIILVAGDSDFVPAAKIARRKGIDFILDPMGRNVSPELSEHIDGLETFVKSDPYPGKKK